MRLRKWSPAILALALLCAAFAPLARAGTVTFDVSGTLGPVLAGSDPFNFDTQPFEASGSLDANTPPSGTTANSATYDIPGNIQITVGPLGPSVLTGYNGQLTLIAPPSGPDTMMLSFSVSVTELYTAPDVIASLSLPEGTLNGTGLQSFQADVSQPDSYFLFSLQGVSEAFTGQLGITGTASMSDGTPPPPPGVPEPATMSLLAGGVLVLGLKLRGRLTHPQ